MEVKRKPIIAVIPDGHLQRKPGGAEVQLKHSTDVWDGFFCFVWLMFFIFFNRTHNIDYTSQ